ncbi:hypothetical protein EVAR_75597_1 [Eumeta japonica]|uniref:Uncharacterized protein n=1 Tax=Eumeta variegata TaxID=151549 RepID=A0A4C1TZX8_EUMVA|nr:hypothetical protein EVAR_75597_1 [Eumeta japonica]
MCTGPKRSSSSASRRRGRDPFQLNLITGLGDSSSVGWQCLRICKDTTVALKESVMKVALSCSDDTAKSVVARIGFEHDLVAAKGRELEKAYEKVKRNDLWKTVSMRDVNTGVIWALRTI